MQSTNAFDKAVNEAWRRTLRYEKGDRSIALLIRSADWRPLKAAWWRGKEVSVIGVDMNGNFLLRHCDGSVRYGDHKSQADHVVSKSVDDLAKLIVRTEYLPNPTFQRTAAPLLD